MYPITEKMIRNGNKFSFNCIVKNNKTVRIGDFTIDNCKAASYFSVKMSNNYTMLVRKYNREHV